MDAATHPPTPTNETVRAYPPGSAERASLEARLKELAGDPAELTITVGGRAPMARGDPLAVVQPPRPSAVLGPAAQATAADVAEAVQAALAAGPDWRALPFDER